MGKTSGPNRELEKITQLGASYLYPSSHIVRMSKSISNVDTEDVKNIKFWSESNVDTEDVKNIKFWSEFFKKSGNST